jgi:hypothetical protein
MIRLFESRRLTRWGVAVSAVLVLWALLADERYASLLRIEKECISALMQKTGAEYPQELYSLAIYPYQACQLTYREWGVLEKAFLYPAWIIREVL